MSKENENDFFRAMNPDPTKAGGMQSKGSKAIAKMKGGPERKIKARDLLKKVIAQLPYQAKMQALEIIRQEISAQGKYVGTMDKGDLPVDYSAKPEDDVTPYDPTEDPTSGVTKLANKRRDPKKDED